MLKRAAAIGAFISGVTGPMAYAYCLFLGVLSALSLPPYPFIPLYFISIILVLLLLKGQTRAWAAFGYGLCFGIGQFGFSLTWVANAFYAQGDVPTWTAPILVALMVLILSLFPAMAFMIARLLWHKHWFQRALAFSGLMIIFEFLRGWESFIPQFPWNPTSLIWWSSDVMLQSLSITGSLGLGLLTFLAPGLLVPFFDGTVKKSHRIYTPLVGAGIVLGMAVFGWVRLEKAAVPTHEGLVVRLVQANIPQLEKWETEYLRRNLEIYLRLSKQSPGPLGVPNLLIWPETAVPYDLENQPTRQFILSQFPGQSVITGAVRQVLEPEPLLNNSLYVLSGTDGIIARYDKAKLVPFGEYVPFRGILGVLGMQTLVPGSRNYDAGQGNRTIGIDQIPSFGPLICYEIIFSGSVIHESTRPEWLLNATNDAWFGDSGGPRQHFQMSRARAIEEGTPVIRVAGTGISGVIDPYGRVLSKLELNTQGFIDTQIPKKIQERTVFSKFGRFPAVALAVLFFLVGAGSGRAERPRNNRAI